ncbi:MAG: restriction endonuclease, partial [Archaeoglobaceae archaeon]
MMGEYSWITDLIDTDAKAMGVYLALLYLRVKKEENYNAKPSVDEILQEYEMKQSFAKYFVGRGAEVREAISAAAKFIDRLFKDESVLNYYHRKKILDDLELKFIEKFTKAFKKYLRLEIIPKEQIKVLHEALLDIRSQLYSVTVITPAGTTEFYGSNFVEGLKTYHGIKEEEANKLLSYLDSSGLVIYKVRSWYDIYYIPAPCLTDEIIDILKEAEPPKEIKPLLLPPPAPEVIRTSKPTKEILESIASSVLRDLGFKVYTNVKRAARTGDPIEVDVWAEKDVRPMKFSVYVSCKNWDREIDRSVIDEEFGRTMNLRDQPQLKVIVAKKLSEPAKEVAISDGFLV